MNQLKLEKHSGRKRSILLIIKLLIILVQKMKHIGITLCQI